VLSYPGAESIKFQNRKYVKILIFQKKRSFSNSGIRSTSKSVRRHSTHVSNVYPISGSSMLSYPGVESNKFQTLRSLKIIPKKCYERNIFNLFSTGKRIVKE
jgi:hypothetical protein